MNVFSIIVLVVVTGLVIWLCVDTTIYIVKKTKERKLQEKQKKEQVKEDVNTNN